MRHLLEDKQIKKNVFDLKRTMVGLHRLGIHVHGQDYDMARSVIVDLLNADKRVLKNPPYMIGLKELAASSVNIVIRAWVEPSEYWNLFFDMNEKIYKTFNDKGIVFPFPQLDVHLPVAK